MHGAIARAAQTSQYNDDLRTMLAEGYVEQTIDSSFLRPRIEAIHRGMQVLTDTPALGQLFRWCTHSMDGYGPLYKQEVGLEFKIDNERKWKFQYTSGAFAETISSPAARPLQEFFRALDDLDAKAHEIAICIAHAIDARQMAGFPPVTDKVRLGRCITRVLRYRRSKADEHVDRCWLTPHWWASERALKIYMPSGEWRSVDETSYERIAVFPGEKMAACTRGQLGLGTPHGARAPRDSSVDRYAVVSFFHTKDDPDDCAWLRDNRDRIEAWEKRLRT